MSVSRCNVFGLDFNTVVLPTGASKQSNSNPVTWPSA